MPESLRSSASFDEWDLKEGTPGSMGVTWVPSLKAWNFALYSRRATGVTLLLYNDLDQAQPILEERLNPRTNKSGRIWHCWIRAASVKGAAFYAYRVEGRRDPAAGYCFDSEKILLDPFAPAVFFPPDYDRAAACRPGLNDGRAPLGVLPQSTPRSAKETERLPRPSHDLIVYELHVKSFTARANSGVKARNRGTFAGLAKKIPYLKSLGITAVELMPVQQCDPQKGQLLGIHDTQFLFLESGICRQRQQRERSRRTVAA